MIFANRKKSLEKLQWLRNNHDFFLKHHFSDIEYANENYVCNVFCDTSTTLKKGIICCNDVSSEYLNVVNGERVTCDVPIHFANTVYFLGDSITFGLGCEDRHTIPSFLQKFINKAKLSYCVKNYFDKLIQLVPKPTYEFLQQYSK